MDTPLMNALLRYQKANRVRCHMPGHKGKDDPIFGPLLSFDVTEISGTDSLYECSDALRETELLYSRLYDTADSLLSAGGSTLCIQTMLALVAKRGGHIIASRSIHVSAVNAMGLLGLNPVWVYPKGEAQLPGRILPEDIEKMLQTYPDALAVYITSPDYYGLVSDISAISEVCRRYHVPLLVDNAHGAHLRFLQPNRHPIALGASMCCDSLHKTLPTLTGAALLYLGQEFAAQFEGNGVSPSRSKEGGALYRQAKEKMSIFGSTSPNYLIMLSIDRCLSFLDNCDFTGMVKQIQELESIAQERGFRIPSGERDGCKLVLDATKLGYTGKELAQQMRDFGIEPEYADRVWVILLFSPLTEYRDYQTIKRFLHKLPALPERIVDPTPFVKPKISCTLSDAFLRDGEYLPLSQCEGRVAAAVKSPCPPGIPVVMPGEWIDKKLINVLKNSGISMLKVLK